MTELFRREAVRHATRRLEGEVILATPLSIKTLGFFLAAVIFVAVTFLFNASYARKATISGLLLPDQGMIRAASQATGSLQSIMVKEGDIVAAGDRIAVLSLSAVTAGGNVGEAISRGLTSGNPLLHGQRAEANLARLQVELEQTRTRLVKSQAEQDRDQDADRTAGRARELARAI